MDDFYDTVESQREEHIQRVRGVLNKLGMFVDSDGFVDSDEVVAFIKDCLMKYGSDDELT